MSSKEISFKMVNVEKSSLNGGESIMSFLGNIVWFVLGGFISFLSWSIIGVLWCITIVGIPFGLQFFKIAKLSLAPFGARIV